MYLIDLMKYEPRSPEPYSMVEGKTRVDILAIPVPDDYEAVRHDVIQAIRRSEGAQFISDASSNDVLPAARVFRHLLKFTYSDGRPLIVGYNDPSWF